MMISINDRGNLVG